MRRLAIALTLALALVLLLVAYQSRQRPVVGAGPVPRPPSPVIETFHCEVRPAGDTETGWCIGPAPACARTSSLNCVSGTLVDPSKNVRGCHGSLYNSAKVCLGR